MRKNEKDQKKVDIPKNFSFFANRSVSKISLDSSISINDVKNPIYDMASDDPEEHTYDELYLTDEYLSEIEAEAEISGEYAIFAKPDANPPLHKAEPMYETPIQGWRSAPRKASDPLPETPYTNHKDHQQNPHLKNFGVALYASINELKVSKKATIVSEPSKNDNENFGFSCH